MSKVLKTVSLVTENCEIFTFDAKYLTWIDYTKNQEIRFPYEEANNEMMCLCFANNAELLVEETQAFSFNWQNRTDITIVDFLYVLCICHGLQVKKTVILLLTQVNAGE
jgi:hypothetical protein